MYKNDAAATYLHEHPACTVCGRPAVFVTASRPFSAFCYGCAPTYLHQGGRALVEIVRFDSDSAAAGSVKPYGRQWDETARAYLEKHPYCERCLRHGKHTRADLVHHKTYVANGGTDGTSNLEALCHSCHEYEHKRHSKGDGNMDAQNELDNAQKTLRKYEAELYRGKAAADEAARTDEAETTEEALARLKEAEAHMYEKEA